MSTSNCYCTSRPHGSDGSTDHRHASVGRGAEAHRRTNGRSHPHDEWAHSSPRQDLHRFGRRSRSMPTALTKPVKNLTVVTALEGRVQATQVASWPPEMP